MARKDFETIYKSPYSSGGAIQNEIVPMHLNSIMLLIDAIESDSDAIIPLRNKLRTLYILYKKGLAQSKELKEKFIIIETMIKDWQNNHKNEKPIKLIQEILTLAEDLFFQWNSSGAGIIFKAHDVNYEKKIHDEIVGNPRT